MKYIYLVLFFLFLVSACNKEKSVSDKNVLVGLSVRVESFKNSILPGDPGQNAEPFVFRDLNVYFVDNKGEIRDFYFKNTDEELLQYNDSVFLGIGVYDVYAIVNAGRIVTPGNVGELKSFATLKQPPSYDIFSAVKKHQLVSENTTNYIEMFLSRMVAKLDIQYDMQSAVGAGYRNVRLLSLSVKNVPAGGYYFYGESGQTIMMKQNFDFPAMGQNEYISGRKIYYIYDNETTDYTSLLFRVSYIDLSGTERISLIPVDVLRDGIKRCKWYKVNVNITGLSSSVVVMETNL